MKTSMDTKAALVKACKLALAGDWHGAHNIAQDYSDDVNNANMANWIHAVLHKIEGDSSNSQYWYAKTKGKKYEDFSEANTELIVIQNSLK